MGRLSDGTSAKAVSHSINPFALKIPMNSSVVTILSHYPSYACNLIQSIQHTHDRIPRICVVRDRHKENLSDTVPLHYIDTTDEFVFARNANRAMKQFKDKDVILINDDCEIVEQDFFYKLHSIAYKYPLCGILSPLIDGGVGNPIQQYPPIPAWNDVRSDTIIVDPMNLCFPCVYIKRSAINKVGYLNEKFTGYGGEDMEYCERTRATGLWTMVDRSLRVKHGAGGNKLQYGVNWSLSFARQRENANR